MDILVSQVSADTQVLVVTQVDQDGLDTQVLVDSVDIQDIQAFLDLVVIQVSVGIQDIQAFLDLVDIEDTQVTLA